jgi:hypothetical protein
MKFFKIYLVISLVFLPLIGMAQQAADSAPAGKGLSPSDSLTVTIPKVTGNVPSPTVSAGQTKPDIKLPGNYWGDAIGDEEEADAEDGFDYQEWLLIWPEQDEGREYDPLDPRDDGPAADTRE